MDGIAASLSGIRTSAQAVGVASNNIANVNTPGYKAQELQQRDLPQGGVEASGIRESQEAPREGGSNVDLASEVVNLKTDAIGYQANLKFLKVQDLILGATLDMRA